MEALAPAAPDSDVLVVGGGAVGLALAIRLARAGVRVIVLEAGSATPPVDYRGHNRGVVVGRPHQGIGSGRMRALGGTTRLWGGQLVAFGPDDLDGLTADGPSPWPVRFAEIEPYLARALALLGMGPEPALRLALPPAFTEHFRLRVSRWLPQPDFTRLFAADLARIDIRTDHPVEALAFDGPAAGVVVRAPDGTTRCWTAPAVVLAAGTFENARLLLAAAATQPGCPVAGNPHLGQGYLDHLHGIAGRLRVANRRALGDLFDHHYRGGRKHSVKLVARGDARGASNGAVTVNAATGVGTLARDTLGLARRIAGGRDGSALALARQSATLARLLLPLAWRYLRRGRSTSLFGREAWLGIELEQIATPCSYLSLDPDAPPATAAIRLHWALDGREIETAAALAEAAAAAFAAAGFGTIELDPRLVARDPAFLADCHDSNHQMGGCRMAEREADGVVDRDLKVFGTSNLHLAGACTFPTGSYANPTLTAIAFALRLADRLEVGA